MQSYTIKRRKANKLRNVAINEEVEEETLAVSNRMEVLMVKRIAKEWLWLLAAAITAIGLSLVDRSAFWRVGETGVVLASIYGLSAFIRITVWAVRTAQKPATT